MTRCLIMGCSQLKRVDNRLLPAVERYDGPLFRVLRKFHRDCPGEASHVAVYVLSARFGLIPGDAPIPYYDDRLSVEAAQQLRDPVLKALAGIVFQIDCTEICLCVSQVYRLALMDWEAHLPGTVTITELGTKRGERQSALYRWLRSQMEPRS